MATLTKDDLDNINTLFTKNFESIWEDNIAPAMATKDDLNELKKEITDELKVEIKKESQATRDYIDKSIAQYSGSSISRDHGLERRIELTDAKLAEKNIFTPQEVQAIKTVPVFDPTSA
ncbi:MAG: hypothetical protein AB1352_03450 [Patescibacteria group bacterium]